MIEIMDDDVLEIDGSELEGGGQILRIALTMSVLNKIPIKVKNIRAGRAKPGLLEQHLKGVELMRDISSADVKGASFLSSVIEFTPKFLQGGKYKSVARTAGSISLLLQVALPCCLLADTDTELELHGGTNTEMAPHLDYTTEVFRPNLEKFGATFDSDLIRRGYFPRGGGSVIINIRPAKKMTSVTMIEQGTIESIHGWAFTAGTLPIKMAYEMAEAAKKELKSVVDNVEIECYKEDKDIAPDNAAGIIIIAQTSTGCVLGSSALGKRGEQSADAGARAANSLLKSIREGACVDEYCQDQLPILMALAEGTSKIRVGEITLHTKTAIRVIEMFDKTCKFNIVPDGQSNIIECLK